MNPFNLCSFNLHGFNQGKLFLSELCLNNDVICIQEHWLVDTECDKIVNFNANFVTVISPAMKGTVNGMYVGRPYGGVAILVHKKYAQRMRTLVTSERYIIIQIDDVVLVNVYLPSVHCTNNYEDVLLDMLTNINIAIQQIPNVIFTGDFNIDFNYKSVGMDIMKNFMAENNLQLCDKFVCSKQVPLYTFCTTGLQHTSFIDHFLVSSDLADLVTKSEIVDSGCNFSDHLAITLTINCNLNAKTNSECKNRTTLTARLRWDKADLTQYYNYTYSMLQDVVVTGLADSNDINVQTIDGLYEAICYCLNTAAASSVPTTRSNFFKFWWNDNLQTLKEESIAAHRLWSDNGRPKQGAIFEIARTAKAKYKNAIRQADKDYVISVSDDLHDCLLRKDQSSFWQTWHSKFGCDKTQVRCIDGSCDPEVIADKFASVFENVCSVDDTVNHKFKSEFLLLYEQYIAQNADRCKLNIDVELIDRCMRHMKTCKAAGHDGIEVEHLLHAHPVVISLLSTLFNAIVRYGYVPNGFGIGIIIPLVKDKLGNLSDIKNYRGITLSSTIAKLFEMCLFELVQEFLLTSNLQFGFKKKLSCSHAIYTMQSVINYYTTRGSTVNVCVLDIVKAFDKVNHYCLYAKLIHKNVPVQFLHVIINWYSKCFACVKWNNMQSGSFRLCGGVRQGGVLSPILFIFYVNDIIEDLQKQGLGCRIDTRYLGCIMYADDLVLLVPSLHALQLMIDKCKTSCESLGLSLSVSKSAVTRVGPAFKHDCVKVRLGTVEVEYVNIIRYLGVYTCTASKFKLSYHEVKTSFYRALNGLLCKTKGKFDDIVMLRLVDAYCKPLLLYGSEVFSGAKSYDSALKRAWNYVFWKIFGVNETTACEIQIFTGICSIEDTMNNKRLSFLSKLPHTGNDVVTYLQDLAIQ